MFYTQVYIKCNNELRGKINNQRREGWATERLGSSLEVTKWVVKKSCAAWLQSSHPTFEHSTECFQLGHLKKCYESHSQDRLKDRKEEQTDDGRWGRVNVTLHSWVPWRQWVSWRLGEISNKLHQCQLSKQCLTGEPINRVYSSDIHWNQDPTLLPFGKQCALSRCVIYAAFFGTSLLNLGEHCWKKTKNQFIWSMEITIVHGWALHIWKLLISHYGRCYI